MVWCSKSCSSRISAAAGFWLGTSRTLTRDRPSSCRVSCERRQSSSSQMLMLGQAGVWKPVSNIHIQQLAAQQLLKQMSAQYNNYREKINRVLQSSPASSVLPYLDETLKSPRKTRGANSAQSI